MVAVATATLAAFAALPASGAPHSVGEKQRQAQAIVAEINSLDSDLNRAVESYDGARLHLRETQAAIRSNTHLLAVARHNVKRSQKNLAGRLSALYMSGDQPSTIEIILGAKSLDDVMSRIDAAQQVTAQDTEIAREAVTARTQFALHQKQLVAQRKKAAALLAEAAAKKDAIEAGIRRRQQLLSSVRGEIARMQEVEHRRQLQIAAQVRARLAQQATAEKRAARATTAPDAKAIGPYVTATTSSAPAADPTSTTPTSTATAPPGTVGAAPPPSRYGSVVAIAMRYLGVPYQWGGASPATGFDCSGFTMYVYAQVGVSLPHYTGDQWQMGTAVSRGDLQPGDLVFFDGLGHEGIYIGDNQFIHAPHTGDVVKISTITGWYADTYVGARRL